MQFAAGRLRLERTRQVASEKLKQLVEMVEPLEAIATLSTDSVDWQPQPQQDDVVMTVRKGRALYGEVLVGVSDSWRTAHSEDIRRVEIVFKKAERFLMFKLLTDVVHPLLAAAFVSLAGR